MMCFGLPFSSALVVFVAISIGSALPLPEAGAPCPYCLGEGLKPLGRVLRLARTIADLDGLDRIEVPQVAEAVGYRRLDRGR